MIQQTVTRPFSRTILENDAAASTTSLLQSNLTTLIDLALVLKQAHWNIIGKNFRSVHLQLDEIIAGVRDASDEVAERIATLGFAADGRAKTVAADSVLNEYADTFLNVDDTLNSVGDALAATIEQLRTSISKLGELDPVSEDMLIGISGGLEKHLWMIQAQEQ